MQTQLPAEGSSVVTRIHRNQVRSNLLTWPDVLQVFTRALVLQLGHMTLRFSDIMKRHHATQTAFREKCKAQIGRQLHIGEWGEQVGEGPALSPLTPPTLQ